MTVTPKATKPRFVRPSAAGVAESQPLVGVGSLDAAPNVAVFTPSVAGVRLSAWTERNRPAIAATLATHGAILFRGFPLEDQSDFEQWLDAYGMKRMSYMEGATPRRHLSGSVYTSTEFPSEHEIALHNELSYVNTWPLTICFFCLTAAETGGETPIGDVRRVYSAIPPPILDEFRRRGWMLVRNFGDGFGLTWQQAYHVEDRESLDRYAAGAGLGVEWRSGNRLRTRQTRPAIATHPTTGDKVWFNHIAFWHASSLDPTTRALMTEELGEDGLPYNTFYGDGSPIPDAIVEQLRDAYRAATVAFPWQQGDLLLLDNMLVAHGRRPFTGARKMVVAMGDPFTRTVEL